MRDPTRGATSGPRVLLMKLGIKRPEQPRQTADGIIHGAAVDAKVVILRPKIAATGMRNAAEVVKIAVTGTQHGAKKVVILRPKIPAIGRRHNIGRSAVDTKAVIPRPKIAATGMKHGAKKVVILRPEKAASGMRHGAAVVMKPVGIRPAIVLNMTHNESTQIAMFDKNPMVNNESTQALHQVLQIDKIPIASSLFIIFLIPNILLLPPDFLL